MTEDSFTNQKPRIATDADTHASWSGGRDGLYFRCYLCGHRFKVGDQYRWIYTSNRPGAGGNPIVCAKCDGPDDKVIEQWKAMLAGFGQDTFTDRPIERPPWGDYFMKIAEVVSTRGTCRRKQVGALIVNSGNVLLSSGYNGAPSGQPHCTEAGCDVVDGHCVRTVHAEMNAILQAAKEGTAVSGTTLYTTASPCSLCAKMIVNAGIRHVVYGQFYRDEEAVRFLQQAGVTTSTTISSLAREGEEQ